MGRRRKDGRKGKRWSYTAGSRPHTVRVYERTPGAVIQIAARDPTARDGRGGERRESLGHRNREEAKRYADEQAVLLRKGLSRLQRATPTVRHVFALYREHRTPDKGEAAQQEDDRQMEMWTRVLGAEFDLSNYSRREHDGWIRRRLSGEVDARGHYVPEPKERCEVGARTVQKDLLFLRAVSHWACEFRDEQGRLLMERDPTRGLAMPKEKNPNRPVATHDRVDAIRKVYRKITMCVERGGTRETVESYLPELFEIIVGTGRRISAVCGLRSEDLELETMEKTPWGAIVWPEDMDKLGKRWRCPVGPEVREAVESALKKRRHIGPGWLFPSAGNPERPVRYEEASVWLREAEKKAKLEPQKGTLWHAYRRLWASARKDLPDVDVAQAGGWASLDALKMAYQQPDDATMLRVVTHQTELREVR
jgi:integrase